MKYRSTKRKTRRATSVRRLAAIKRSSASQQHRATKRRVRQAQPLHKRFFLHPITVLMLLCTGVLIIGWTYKVIADSYTVTATVEAAPLGQGAEITFPANGSVINSQPVTVSGTCPNNSYVNLYVNDTFSGVAWCSISNVFTIETSLFSGTNVLRVQDYNVTDQAGPASPIVTVTYSAPKNSASGNPSTSTPSATPAAPLLLTSDFRYQTFTTGHDFDWTMNVQGGKPPYNVTVNWGDGQTSNYYLPTDPTFQISHVYKQNGYYPIMVSTTDANKQTKIIQLAALIKQPGAAGIFTPPNSNDRAGGVCTAAIKAGFAVTSCAKVSHWFSNLLSGTSKYLWIAWPSYIIIVLMVVSFWLGERQEFQSLKPYSRRYRH